MKFTIEPEPFVQMLEMLGKARPDRRRADPTVRLVACRGRVCVERAGTVAEIDAVVWEDGQCTLSRGRLLNLVKTHRLEPELTLEAHAQGLRLDGLTIPLTSYCPFAVAPGAFQIFLATDLGVVPSVSVPPLELAAAR